MQCLVVWRNLFASLHRHVMFGVGALLAVALSVTIAAPPTHAKILDPATKFGTSRDVLAALADSLEAVGIDVRLGAASPRTEPSLAARSQLAPLVTMPVPEQSIAVEAMGFSGLFLETLDLGKFGYEGSLIAINGGQRTSERDPKAFRTAWENAPVSQRVFLSFTSADREQALEIAAAMRGKGFAVFTYLAEEDRKVWVDTVQVGKYFAEAQHRLVLDTPRARLSQATQVERAAAVMLAETSTKRGGQPTIEEIKARLDERITRDATTSGSAGGGACCQLCASPSALRGQLVSTAPKCADVFKPASPKGTAQSRVCSKTICGTICQNAG